MSGLDNLNKRLQYRGGSAKGRLEQDKLKSLKKALLYSYQAETAVLKDGREFKCLINPDKLKPEYDNKIISIPYKDTCLTSGLLDTIDLKPGDVFTWKENQTFWIVFLQYLEESAYFRAEIRRCKSEIDINKTTYKVYVRGPIETAIRWEQKKEIVSNDLNYSLSLYITKNKETLDYFHRFKKIKLKTEVEKDVFKETPWEVQAVNEYDADGIIEVHLRESYNNSMEEEKESQIEIDIPDVGQSYIKGPKTVYPYDIVKYEIKNANNGTWNINSSKAKIINIKDSFVTIEITTGRSGNFDLIYKRENEDDIIFPIIIESL